MDKFIASKFEKELDKGDIRKLGIIKDKKKIYRLLKNNFFPFENYEKHSKKNFVLKRLDKKLNKLSKKEEQYFIFLYEFLYTIDTNITEISKGLKSLLNRKNLMPSIFLLRGMMELIFFNIFVTMKCFLNIKKNNADSLIDLILRASMASGVDGITQKKLKSESAIYKKIILKYGGKRIHINDCIRFYRKNVICKIFKEKGDNKSKIYKSLNQRINLLNKDPIFEFMNFVLTNEELSAVTGERIINTYDKMCEIIHPTAIKIYDASDEKIQYDFRDYYLTILDSPLFLINLHLLYYKDFICDWFLENKKTFIDTFNQKLE